jgi:RNA polymerase sigma-70 factor (ECF subfamily)
MIAAMAAAEFRAQVEALRPYLLRYASLQLRNREAAEDAVQETLLAALSAEGSFEGRSNMRTWVTGILKHKCIDAVRRAAREVPLGDEEAAAAQVDGLFDEREHWREHPRPWDDPDAALQEKQFLQALEACLGKLPSRTAQVFMLREHLGLDTSEICKQLGISAGNCAVLLHRARMALRLCLDTNWFAR